MATNNNLFVSYIGTCGVCKHNVSNVLNEHGHFEITIKGIYQKPKPHTCFRMNIIIRNHICSHLSHGYNIYFTYRTFMIYVYTSFGKNTEFQTAVIYFKWTINDLRKFPTGTIAAEYTVFILKRQICIHMR